MRSVLLAALVSLVVSLIGTPFAIRLFRAQGYGQLIRDDGPEAHHTKRGTPTMGGAVIIVAAILGYVVAVATMQRQITASGLLVLFVMLGLGIVGFLDDFIKIRKQRSLGLTARMKFVGQLAVSVAFALLALHYVGESISHVSFVRDTALNIGAVGFVVWAYVMISATSNGVNLTDGLDGLASGSAALVFAAYVVIAFWQFGNRCPGAGCYPTRDPLDLAVVSAAAMGACFGFLWWNAAPAKIFMGDTGSLSLGGALAALAILSRTELLLIILGGLFVVETLSVILQVAAYKLFRRRVFAMAPIHHHFELSGWPEFTVIVRFWIVAGLAVAFGLGLFYHEFLGHDPLE